MIFLAGLIAAAQIAVGQTATETVTKADIEVDVSTDAIVDAEPIVGPLPSDKPAAEVNTAASKFSAAKEVAPTLEGSLPAEGSPIAEGAPQTVVKPVEVVDPTLQPTLKLLGAKVKPGTSDILTWEMESSFQDVSAPVSVLVVNGKKVGPTVCITAAVHGDELNGIEIVRRVVYETDPKTISGAVIGVPIVNLEGFKRANRYLPDRRDLNRYFPGQERGSYASRIAYSFFNRVIKHCDYLVDLHTGSLSRTNLPQIRANLSDPNVASLAEKMGSIVVLQSRGGSGTLRRAATDIGIPAVTLEAGGPNNLQKEAVEQGVVTLTSTLNSLGIISKGRWKRNAEPTFYRSKWVRARQGGILFSRVELGDNVKQGSVLGLLSNPITNKTNEILSPLEGRVIGMALNQVMYPGFAAYHIGLKSSMVEAAHPEDDEANEGLFFELDERDDGLGDDNEFEIDNPSASEGEVLQDEDYPASPQQEDKPEIREMELPTAGNM
ncbi:MAG TPA: succinylglutamate desuccinylase [Gammaproteobacteria bacterium]|nr:succinylglutamate desuccinylase [Gammaproteobacteria bacterium]